MPVPVGASYPQTTPQVCPMATKDGVNLEPHNRAVSASCSGSPGATGTKDKDPGASLPQGSCRGKSAFPSWRWHLELWGMPT